jgi:hypothetical protein
MPEAAGFCLNLDLECPMKSLLRVALAIVFFVDSGTFLAAQSPTAASKPANHKPSKKSTSPLIEAQIQQMRQELQSQIDDLKTRLAAKDSEIEALQSASQTVQDKTATVTTQVRAADLAEQQTAAAMDGLRSSINDFRAEDTNLVTKVEQTQKATEEVKKSVDEPTALHYKGITIVPGGFTAAESIWRQRAMNADLYTNYNATPYMNSGEAHTSEWVPSARQTRLSTLFSGKVPFGTLNGFVEGDFLSAGTTSNNLQSNSYTLRIRQAWAQAVIGSWKFTGGQMWTLLTEDRKATDAGQEIVPIFFDGNLHVGDTYLRQPGFRVQDAITSQLTVAASVENSQYQFSASNAPSNFFFGNAGAAGGLNNPSANYTNQVAPDVLVKASFEPGYGHYEIGGVARFFRDRYYPNGTTSAGAQNDTRLGGGFVANAHFPVTTKLDVGLHVVAGDGTGRYGVSLLPDVTARPDGTLAPLHNAQGLLSLEFHPNKRLDIFGYVGTEYAQRTYYRSSTGTLVGYAPPTASNMGCNVEAVPTAGTGYAPGVSTCLGATRVVVQGSAGWVYRLYTGPVGRLQYGLAYSYLTREGWTGVGGAPKATNNFVYTSFRYFLP